MDNISQAVSLDAQPVESTMLNPCCKMHNVDSTLLITPPGDFFLKFSRCF